MAARRTKKTPVAEPAAFTVGEPELSEPTGEEYPPIQEETIDGLLSLRGHLEQRVPGGLLWPLQKLPSMSQHMSDIESAGTAVDSIAVRHAMSNTKLAELQTFLLFDAYSFGYLVCGHRDMLPEVHMPMCYAAAGQAGKLAWYLTQSGLDGYIADSFRAECRSRSIDLATMAGVYELDRALDWCDLRLPRGVFKSSAVTHTGSTLTATNDPNTTAKITTAIDDKAFELLEQVGATILSGRFKDLFPHRVPEKSRDVSKDAIKFAGRTISHPQTTIQAGGYIGKDIGGHYDVFWTDDLVVRGPRGNATASALPGVIKWLSGMRGYFMLTRRVRRVSVGTVAIEGDDYTWYTQKGRRHRVYSINIPIETFPEGYTPKTIFERGIPTMPTFLPVERINEIQTDVLAADDEAEGIENWLCDYRLIPAAAGGKMFTPELVNDPDREWMGPYEHPKARTPKGEIYKDRFLVARIERNELGVPTDFKKKPLDVNADSWRDRTVTASFDPWEDLDIIATVNTCWTHGARSWSVTAAGVDPHGVRFQLETRIGDNGVDGWASALDDLGKLYKPRTIGMDRKCFEDPAIQKRFVNDARLRPYRGRVHGIDMTVTATHEARVRSSVFEPFTKFQWLLLPKSENENDYGAKITRRELMKYRAGADNPWPIIDSLAMVDALVRRVATREERAESDRARRAADDRYRRSIGELGVPRVA